MSGKREVGASAKGFLEEVIPEKRRYLRRGLRDEEGSGSEEAQELVWRAQFHV